MHTISPSMPDPLTPSITNVCLANDWKGTMPSCHD